MLNPLKHYHQKIRGIKCTRETINFGSGLKQYSIRVLEVPLKIFQLFTRYKGETHYTFVLKNEWK